MRWMLACALTGLLAGCLEARSITCDDGTVCASGTVCSSIHQRCLTSAQATVCAPLAEGALCSADGRNGRCDRGACLPGCGDGVPDEGEQCDDENFLSHDGCSSTCRLEAAVWTRWENPWQPRTGHAAAYAPDKDRLVVFGGASSTYLGDTWVRVPLPDGGASWQPIDTGAAPTPRRSAALAYDRNRHVFVLFGGRDAESRTLDDTWELSEVAGSWTWTKASPTVSPPGRARHGLAYDPIRQQVILFGGFGATLLGDTWGYDGTTWAPIAVTSSPSTRGDHAMTWDDARQRVVIFGGVTTSGYVGETWELGPSTWSPIAGAGPPARGRPGLAYSETLGGSVLVGGRDEAGWYGDVWLYDGSWTQQAFDTPPPAVGDTTLTTTGDRLVLVGGSDANDATDAVWEYSSGSRWERVTRIATPTAQGSAVRDGSGAMLVNAADGAVWRFDGATWTLLAAPAVRPSVRSVAATVYDPVADQLVQFGGQEVDGGPIRGDTWMFDGMSFLDVTAVGDPSPRGNARMVYDVARGRIVLFGGTQGGMTFSDTWERDTAWTAVIGATGPAEQRTPPMGYDRERQQTILLANDGTTWTYDGTWRMLDVPALAEPVRNTHMIFDPWRKRMVVFGGAVAQGVTSKVLELGEDGWGTRPVSGETPAPRSVAAIASVDGAHGIVVHGGTGLTTTLVDTWILSYRSDTPEEACADGSDNDGDLRIDDADPDCTLPP